MALITTPGASDANSYVSVSDASEYFRLSYNRTAWANAGTSDKERALAEATRVLDTYVQWFGDIASETQALRWPRSNVIDQDGRAIASDTIPKPIQNLTCEMAYQILNNSGFDVTENDIDRVKIGSLDINFDINQKSNGFNKSIRDALAFWGILTMPSSSSFTTAKLIRT